MMPTIEVTEDTLKKLKMLAEPFVDTPDSVIARLAEEAMAGRTAPKAVNWGSPAGILQPDPDDINLTFTKVVGASVDGKRVSKANWNRVLRKTHEVAYDKVGKSFDALGNLTRANISQNDLGSGYTEIADGAFYLQGQDANQAWLTIQDLARQLDIPVEVAFEWREKDDVPADKQGRKGLLAYSPTKTTV